MISREFGDHIHGCYDVEGAVVEGLNQVSREVAEVVCYLNMGHLLSDMVSSAQHVKMHSHFAPRCRDHSDG